MPYRSTWHPRGLQLDAYGVVTLQDVLDEQVRFYGDPRSDSAKFVIWNSLGAEEIRLDLDDFLPPAASDIGASRSVRGLRVALVAKDPTMWAVCERYKELLSRHQAHWTVELFEDLEQARRWVGA